MTAKSDSAVGFPAARVPGLLTGLVAAGTLLLTAWPAAARQADANTHQPLAGPHVDAAAPVLNGNLSLLLEQHTRRGGSGGGGGSSSGGSGGGGQAVPRGGSGGGGTSSGGSTPSGGGQSGGTSQGGARTRSGSGADSGGDSGGTPTYSRPRGDRPATGRAVERRPGQGGTVIVGGGGYYGGFYPWGWGGLGLGGYYGYYDPYGWYDPYPPVAYGYGGYDGALKLKVKPRQAEVYVDGYFAGAVDDYDGVFQRLKLEPGPHRIEIRLDGYEPLTFEVRIQPDRTVTYKGEMQKADTGN